MEVLARPVEEWPQPLVWFGRFLKEELAPYPGRNQLVARMVISATLVMLITMMFRLPFGVQAIYALAISRETHWATIKAAQMAILILAAGAAYVIVGTMFSLSDPLLHMLWVIGSLFNAFLALRIIADYPSATGFGIMVTLAIPILDAHIPTELKVTQTLWAAGQTILAAVIASLVASVFSALKPGNFLVRSITDRLASVENVFDCYAVGRPIPETTGKNVARMVMLGTSALRRTLKRSGYTSHYAEQMGVVVALVGRLVDLAGSFAHLDFHPSEDDRRRIQVLAQNIARFRDDLTAERIPNSTGLSFDKNISQPTPHLAQIEQTVSLMIEVFAGSNSLNAYAPPLPGEGDPPQRIFVPDAFSNPDHLKFALKGCLAASLCYIIYTAVDWPGIRTAIVTCVLTALTTIGGSRQKQILRISGAAVGGIVIGMGAQIFILPYLDSIAGFTLLFIAVTTLAAWFATSSPRLSYFGIQLGLAFFLINLQEFRIQTSLAVARDRVAGVVLGLSMMWLVFDQLWSAPTGSGMRKTFTSLFRLLARLVEIPVSGKQGADVEQSYSLRETINSAFNQVRALADAVWFEFGPSRQQDLALRSRILTWQAQLRPLFINCIALVKYRMKLPGFELPESSRPAEQDFEDSLARALEGMAGRLDCKASVDTKKLEAAFVRLSRSAPSPEADPQGRLAVNLRTFLLLTAKITDLAVSLGRQIETDLGTF